MRPLDDHALASRLSYFLWSSMPDAELLAHATKRTLHQPAVLAAQARRMLRDDRARALAVEFAGQWLDFRRFEEHNAVDRERFPGFDAQLRQAMFEEPVRFFDDVARQNRSVLDFLYGQHTFVNAPLARHYGMPDCRTARATPNEWVRVDDAGRYQRGGLLPMAVFLTKNAPGLRTSPVKRGYWVVRRVLGEHIPAPPAQVPELPSDERKLGDLTLREMLARHRENEACAGCHARFDSFGLAFEGYGPVGEVRQVDLGGRPVETQVSFPGGQQGSGLGWPARPSAGRAAGRLPRQPVPQAAELRPGPGADAVGRADHREDAGAAGRRRPPLRRPGGHHRAQPAVPDPTGRRIQRQPSERSE